MKNLVILFDHLYDLNMFLFFFPGKQRWTAVDRRGDVIETQYNALTQNLGVSAQSSEPIYFLAPGTINLTKYHFFKVLFSNMNLYH